MLKIAVIDRDKYWVMQMLHGLVEAGIAEWSHPSLGRQSLILKSGGSFDLRETTVRRVR
jgi:hypothetical protein